MVDREAGATDGWRGTVVYGDNHSNFETASTVKTSYTPRGLPGPTQDSAVNADDLFADNNDDAGAAGNDAAMVHQDVSTYANQK